MVDEGLVARSIRELGRRWITAMKLEARTTIAKEFWRINGDE